MRVLSLAGAIMCLALAAACSSPEKPGGNAAPAGSPGGPSASASATVAPGTTSAAATRPATAPQVLGPDGVGALRLGMSKEQADATGLLVALDPNPAGENCVSKWRLRGASGERGFVLHSKKLGIAAIDAYGTLKTPEGIGIGSSLTAVKQAYPDYRDDDNLGRGYPAVRGNNRAQYRIEVDRSNVVSSVTLQYTDQDCYE